MTAGNFGGAELGDFPAILSHYVAIKFDNKTCQCPKIYLKIIIILN